MAKRITIENAELTMTIGGSAYAFPWVVSVNIADPRENVLATSPQSTGDGIVYRTGISTPVTSDMIVREVPTALFNLMKQAFELQQRVDILLFDKNVGDQYTLDESVIRTNPSNLTMGEGESTFDVTLNLSTATGRFGHKPPIEA